MEQKDLVEWSKESIVLAKTQAYRNRELTASIDDNNGALLPVDYPKTAKAVAEKQVMLSAYRLFDLLKVV